MPELFLYVGNGYFNAFCTRVHKVLSDKISYAFSSAYSIKPTPKAQENPSPNLIEYEDGKIEEEIHHIHGTVLRLIQNPQIHY